MGNIGADPIMVPEAGLANSSRLLRGVPAIAMCLCIATAAQGADSPEHAMSHGTGLVFADPLEYGTYRATPLYSNFLPEAIDLSASFPSPGNQGWQSSCVGWAVGYAARSYYAFTVEAADGLRPQSIGRCENDCGEQFSSSDAACGLPGFCCQQTESNRFWTVAVPSKRRSSPFQMAAPARPVCHRPVVRLGASQPGSGPLQG